MGRLAVKMVAFWPMFIGVLVVDFGSWGQSRCLDSVKNLPEATPLASARLASAMKRRWLQDSASPAPTEVPVPTMSPSQAPAAEPSTAEPSSPPALAPQPTPPPTPSPEPTAEPTAEATAEPSPAPETDDDTVERTPVPSTEPLASATTAPVLAPTSGEPTPAPTAGLVGQLSGSILAPTVALMNDTAASGLEDALKLLLDIEDQEEVDILIPSSSRRRLLSITRPLLGGGGGGDGVVRVGVRNGSNSGLGSEGLGGLRRGIDDDDVVIGVGQDAEGEGKLEQSAVVALAGARIGGQGLSQNPAGKDEGGATGSDEAEALTINAAETAAAVAAAEVRRKGLRNRRSSPEAVDYRESGSGDIAGSVDDVSVGDGRRHLADSEEISVAQFTVDFADDEGEESAAYRGVMSVPRLLNGTSVIAAAIWLTAGEISFQDLVYSTTEADAVLTDEARATFEGGDGTSGSSIAIAVAFILAALIASACVGAIVGRCWLHKERKRRDDIKAKLPPHPAYERSALGTPGENGTSGAAGDHSAGSLTGRPLLRSSAGVPSSSTEASATALGRLTPPVAAGGMVLLETNGVPRRGNNNQWLCEPSESSGPSGQGVAVGSGLGLRGVASGEVGEMLEHDYGDDGGRTESFVSRGDGNYSEFEGQSEYGSVVPGGQVHDGVLSEGGSSRCYYDGDQDQSSEWGTDVGSVDQGSFAGFPPRKDISARFSSGPKSQASFAAPSVAASGRSAQSSMAQSSVVTGRSFPSRTNFPSPGGLAGSPPYGAGGRAVKGGGSAGLGFGAGGSALDASLIPGSGLRRDEGVMRGTTKQNDAAAAAIADGASEGRVEVRGSLGRGGSFKEGRPPRVTSTGDADGGARGAGATGRASGDEVGERPSFAELAAAAAAAADASETEAKEGENNSGDGEITGRASMDSAAGSVAMSSVAHSIKSYKRSNGTSPPRSMVAGAVPTGGGAGTGATRGGRGGAAAPGVAASVAGSVGSGRFSIPGKQDDDAASQYAGSSVAGERIHSAVDDTGTYVGSYGGRRPPLRGPGSGLGKNFQSIGATTAAESSHGSDRESFVSRVGSYALTDIGTLDRDAVGGGSGGRCSPTSTLMRSTAMSELESENSRVSLGSPYGSEGGYNSDSPGAQSGWERAWMRQRNDARHFRGAGEP